MISISAFARGLLSVLGATNRGVGLREVQQEITPTMNVEPYLLVAKRRAILYGPFNVVAGSLTELPAEVPAGKLWRMHQVEFDVDLAAGDTLTGVHLIMAPSEGAEPGGMGLSLTESVPVFTGPLSLVKRWEGNGLLVPAGTKFGVHWFATLAAGPLGGIMRIHVDEIDV